MKDKSIQSVVTKFGKFKKQIVLMLDGALFCADLQSDFSHFYERRNKNSILEASPMRWKLDFEVIRFS